MEIELDSILEALKKLATSPDRLFGYVWILCWICAIWVYHLQLFLTGIFCLFLALVIFDKHEKKQKSVIPAVFSMDKNTRTLKVQKIYDQDLKWEDNQICSGDAILPAGFVREGDEIKNCKGNIAIRHIPSNKIMGAFNFEK